MPIAFSLAVTSSSISSPRCCSNPSIDPDSPQSIPPPTLNTQRFRARVAYDGTDFNGWQFQPRGRTVQADIERILSRRFPHTIRVIGASRTDAGVHARGQGVHFDIPNTHAPKTSSDCSQLQFVLNQMLSEDVRLSHISHAPLTTPADPLQRPWSAIYSARGKRYAYRFCTAPILDPLQRLHYYREWRAPRTGFCEQTLRAGLNRFVGTHNFAAFANTAHAPAGIISPVKINPIRTVRSAQLIKEAEHMYRVEFDIDGAFYRMIRNIMGTLLDLSCFKLRLDDIDHLFESRDRRLVPKAAPAKGLCLEEVFYDGWPM